MEEQHSAVREVLTNKDLLVQCIFKFFDVSKDLETLSSAARVNRRWRDVINTKILNDTVKQVHLEMGGVNLNNLETPEELATKCPVDKNKLLAKMRGVPHYHILTLCLYPEMRGDLEQYVVIYALLGNDEFNAVLDYLRQNELLTSENAEKLLWLSAFHCAADTFMSLLSETTSEFQDKFFKNEEGDSALEDCITHAGMGGNYELVKHLLAHCENVKHKYSGNIYVIAFAWLMVGRHLKLAERFELKYEEHLQSSDGAKKLANCAVASDSIEFVEKYYKPSEKMKNGKSKEEMLSDAVQGDAPTVFKYFLETYKSESDDEIKLSSFLERALDCLSLNILSFILDHPDCDLKLSKDPETNHPRSDALIAFIDKITNREFDSPDGPRVLAPIIKRFRLKLECVEGSADNQNDYTLK